ncbi:hypothetical protein M426DRAFT_316097 [Hypoxylon sp. CI-4A]|nr:hypothetical protein M426DRAFT_316097 [Hypoxylon sp. CI-4A]
MQTQVIAGVRVPSTKTLALSIPPVLLSAYLLYRLSPLSAPKKRPRSPSNDQAGPARWTRRSELMTEEEEESETSEEDEEHEINEEGLEKLPFEYYCIFRPFFDIENENEDKDEDDQVDEDDLIEQYNKEIHAEDSIEAKPAREHPEHRWVAMWETSKLFSTWERRASYTNPEFFNMYISKNFHGNGMQEMVENMLIAFDREFSRKKRDKKNVKRMWAILAAIMQWLLEIPLHSWFNTGDPKKLETTTGLVGRALVSGLNELDRARLLKADSEIKDLGLVLTFYLHWADSLKNIDGIELPFCKEVVAYAKKAGIDFKEAGCYGAEEKVKALEKDIGRIKPLSGSPKADRWEWKRKFRKFARDYKIGGEKYNILKMSRSQRASYAHDKKDPLADVPDKALQEGTVRVRGGGVISS